MTDQDNNLQEASTKVAVITGAAQGIGAAMVSRFLRDQYNVVALDSDAEAFSEFTKSHDSSRVLSILTDISAEAKLSPRSPKPKSALVASTLSSTTRRSWRISRQRNSM